jgi:GTP-binding protein HflX
MRYRAQRQRSLIPIIALVGYTNAGKSTLLNYLANSKVFVANQLFATLDPTTRRVALPGGNVALLTDTVGFIQKLPTQLIAAFRATLEEITEADLLLHIIDSSHPNAIAHEKTVRDTLAEIGAGHIPTILVLNKIDRYQDPDKAREIIRNEFNGAIAISALLGEGIPDLLRAVEQDLFENFQEIQVKIPFQRGDLISLFHEQGQVHRSEHERGGVIMNGLIPGRFVARFTPFFDLTSSRDEEIDDY